jgi:hypothetical protein
MISQYLRLFFHIMLYQRHFQLNIIWVICGSQFKWCRWSCHAHGYLKNQDREIEVDDTWLFHIVSDVFSLVLKTLWKGNHYQYHICDAFLPQEILCPWAGFQVKFRNFFSTCDGACDWPSHLVGRYHTMQKLNYLQLVE